MSTDQVSHHLENVSLTEFNSGNHDDDTNSQSTPPSGGVSDRRPPSTFPPGSRQSESNGTNLTPSNTVTTTCPTSSPTSTITSTIPTSSSSSSSLSSRSSSSSRTCGQEPVQLITLLIKTEIRKKIFNNLKCRDINKLISCSPYFNTLLEGLTEGELELLRERNIQEYENDICDGVSAIVHRHFKRCLVGCNHGPTCSIWQNHIQKIITAKMLMINASHHFDQFKSKLNAVFSSLPNNNVRSTKTIVEEVQKITFSHSYRLSFCFHFYRVSLSFLTQFESVITQQLEDIHNANPSDILRYESIVHRGGYRDSVRPFPFENSIIRKCICLQRGNTLTENEIKTRDHHKNDSFSYSVLETAHRSWSVVMSFNI